MEWHKHSALEGKHAFLSPSGWHWINYDDVKLKTTWINMQKKEEGTLLHITASLLINQHIKLPPIAKAFNQFVNDALGFDMQSEQVLYYSDNCFGTADAIKYVEEDKVLMIHDLKTGNGRVSPNQLYIYAAIFCLEYGIKPAKHQFVCRIYQGNGYDEFLPEPSFVKELMDKIVSSDAILNGLKNSM